MKRESLTHFPDHRRCLIIPRTEVKLLFHLSNEPCVTFQWIVSTWKFRCAGKRRRALVYGSSATQKKKRDEHRSVPVDSVFSRVLTRCWCGACAVKHRSLHALSLRSASPGPKAEPQRHWTLMSYCNESLSSSFLPSFLQFIYPMYRIQSNCFDE